MEYIAYYFFSFFQVLVVFALFVGLPALYYYRRVKPTLGRKAWSVLAAFGLMIVTASIPMGWLLLFRIWQIAVVLLLVITAIVWIIGSIKKKTPFTAGPVMVGITALISAALLGNLIALAGAVIYFVALLRYKLDWSFD